MEKTRLKLEKIYKKITKIAQKGPEGHIDYSEYIDELINRGDYDYFTQCLWSYYYIVAKDYIDVAELKKKTYSEICLQTKSGFLQKLSTLYKSKKVSQSSTDIYSYDPINTVITQTGPLSGTYSPIGITASVNFSLVSDQIGLSINDTTTYRVQISKATWVEVESVEIPTKVELFQRIEVVPGVTFSYTQIPTTFAQDYLVTSYERGPYDIYNYKLSITKNNLLGTIQEIDLTPSNPNYYIYAQRVARFYGDFNTYLEVTKVGGTGSVLIDYFDPKLSDDNNLLKRYELALEYLLS
jgi:hypothetical protein